MSFNSQYQSFNVTYVIHRQFYIPTPQQYVAPSSSLYKEVELRERYPQALVDKVLRVREMYNWFIANHDGTDREFLVKVDLKFYSDAITKS